jgi:tetratricopeptide (TPR) repeat protein
MRRVALTTFASAICILLCAGSSAASQSISPTPPDQMQAAQAPSNPAMDAFELALSSHSDDVAAQHGEVNEAIAQALTLRTTGHMNSALAVLARARAYVPDDPKLLMDFGLQADAMRLYSDADKALSKAHQLAPGDAQILYGLARVELDEQKMPQAETNLRAYLVMNPDDATAHYGLGHLLHMMQRDDEAERELQRSIQLQPQQTESWYQLGEIALSRNQPEQAKQDYDKVLQRDPNHGGALTGLGILAYRAKDYPGASDYLSRAVNVAPNFPAAHRFYAMVLARQGQHQQSAAQEAIADDLTAQQNKLQHGYILLAAPADRP